MHEANKIGAFGDFKGSHGMENSVAFDAVGF
jgi:hypothetical protein